MAGHASLGHARCNAPDQRRGAIRLHHVRTLALVLEGQHAHIHVRVRACAVQLWELLRYRNGQPYCKGAEFAFDTRLLREPAGVLLFCAASVCATSTARCVRKLPGWALLP